MPTFKPEQAVNDSSWLSLNMLTPVITGELRDDDARAYIAECERAGASELAVWLFDVALMTRRIECAPEGAYDAPTDLQRVHGPTLPRETDYPFPCEISTFFIQPGPRAGHVIGFPGRRYADSNLRRPPVCRVLYRGVEGGLVVGCFPIAHVHFTAEPQS